MPDRGDGRRSKQPSAERPGSVNGLARLLLVTGLTVSAILATLPEGLANPKGGQVAAGSAMVSNSSPVQLDIVQSTNRAVIDWQSFDIAVGERTKFQQPSAAAMTLNRVHAADPSTIAGQLTANGSLVLINPSGIVFSKGSQVNVNSIIATPSDITNANFMAGNMRFDRPSPNPNASIVNAGTITVGQKGLAALVAPSVVNSGVIQARLGKVVLAGAETFTLDFYGDGLISFDVGPKVTTVPLGVDGKPVKSLVSNSGTIDAPGGTVLLTADAVAGILENVIDSSGQITAPTTPQGAGTVTVDAGAGNGARLAGTIDVSGPNPGQTGGTAIVTGGAVNLASTAQIKARGPAGGGTVRIGGGPHGTDASVRNAQNATVNAGAVIDASATANGNGGNVVVWSDGTTVFNGTILAKGGPNGGNGGWVETSGKSTLSIGPTASVSAAAPQGKAGLWLLDPDSDVDITGATSNVTCAGTPLVCSPAADSSTLNATTIVNSLNAGTSVTVTTSNAGGTQPGNLTVDASIALTAQLSPQSESLTLLAGAGGGAGTITVNQPIQDASNNTLSLVLTAGGSVAFNNLVNIAGSLTVTAGQNAAGAISQTSPLTATGASLFTNSSTGGTITLTNAS